LWAAITADGSPVRCLHWDSTASQDNSYLLNLEDIGGCLDGKPTAAVPPTESVRLAQYVNHPSAGLRPNVVSLPFLWSDAIDVALRYDHNNYDKTTLKAQLNRMALQLNPLAQGPWFADPVTNEIVTFESGYRGSPAGSAFILKQDVGLEVDHNANSSKEIELLFDYRFSKLRKHRKSLPAWYVPVDDDNADNNE
jgi:hypothetical protein